jgi:hypothetical protein
LLLIEVYKCSLLLRWSIDSYLELELSLHFASRTTGVVVQFNTCMLNVGLFFTISNLYTNWKEGK